MKTKIFWLLALITMTAVASGLLVGIPMMLLGFSKMAVVCTSGGVSGLVGYTTTRIISRIIQNQIKMSLQNDSKPLAE